MKTGQGYGLIMTFAVLMSINFNITASETITLESLLREMVDNDAVARWPDPLFICKQASSYDRAKVAPDKPGWFANGDHSQYIRLEEHDGRKEHVMMEADGPGAIVRFWLTVGGEKEGMIRIYLDGANEPTLTFTSYDLLSGDLNIDAPLAQPHPGYSPKGGGNTLYLPIPYAQQCKVTWEEKSKGARYYQINYRAYTPGTTVKTFTQTALEAARTAIDRVNRMLSEPSGVLSARPLSDESIVRHFDDTLEAGTERTHTLPPGPSAIKTIELSVHVDDPATLEHVLRAMIVQLTFDGVRTVWCPASDFFGSGVGLNPVENRYYTVRADGTMICRWVMPYQKTASITLANIGKQAMKTTLRTLHLPWKWDNRSMHFHTVWHYEGGLKTPPVTDWNYVTISGKGVYVGDTLALFNPVTTWYGEGDEKIWVDGESFPSHMGTGTEDYYSFSYAPKPVHQTPFTNEPRIDHHSTQGHNTLIRTRSLDGIPFQKSLTFDIELMSWKPTTLIYAATTCWYAFSGTTSNIKPQPLDALLPIPTLADAIAASRPKSRPGAIECETMNVLVKSRDFPVEIQEMDPWDSSRWSAGAQVIAKAGRIGDHIELEFTVPDAAPRKLTLFATQAPDYGILSFTVNGLKVDKTFDGYAKDVRPGPKMDLGVFQPRNGKFTLRAEVTGAHPASTGAKYFFGLDCVMLSKP
jgi:hypothetical protein